MESGSGGGGGGPRLRKTEWTEMRWVLPGACEEVGSYHDGVSRTPAAASGSRGIGASDYDDGNEYSEMLRQRLVCTGSRADSFDVEALDIPGVYRHQDAQGSGGQEFTMKFSLLSKWYKAIESLRADIARLTRDQETERRDKEPWTKLHEFVKKLVPEEILRSFLMELFGASHNEILCKKNLMSMVTKKRIFSTSATETDSSLKNGVVFSLNGSKFRILLSYINSIIHYRLWNFVRGTCVDAHTIFGIETKLYTTACQETFNFLVEFEEDLIDLIIDGKQSWFYAIVKNFNSFKFHTCGHNYMEGVDCKELDLSAHYKDFALNDDAGEILIGLGALKNAFKASNDYSGQTTPELQKALGTWVIYFGESPKFHQVFLACCKAIIMEEFNTLNKFDKDLGLMVREWGSLCRIAMKWVLRSLGDLPVSSFDEELEEIKSKGICGIKSVKDIFNNVCLWSNSSPYQLNFVPDPRSKEKPCFRPLDFCTTDEYAKELAKFYRDKIESKTLADTWTFYKDRPHVKTSDETFNICKIHPSFYGEFCDLMQIL